MEDETPEIRIILVLEKETLNTRMFQEAPPPGTQEHIKKLYVSKATLRRLGNPQGLEVVIRPLGRGHA
jgi:hypothetical protein